MKEVELVERCPKKVFDQLKTHIDKEVYILLDNEKDIFGYIKSITMCYNNTIVYVELNSKKDYFFFPFAQDSSLKLFLCLEEDEVFETFDEMVRRKQEEIFRSLK